MNAFSIVVRSGFEIDDIIQTSGPGTGRGDARFTTIKAATAFGVTIDVSGSGGGFWALRTIERDYIK